MIDLIYKKEFYEIKSACIEIRNILGTGFLEKVYENALKLNLRKEVLKLKNVNDITGIHKAQLLNYLKATGIKLGILVNL